MIEPLKGRGSTPSLKPKEELYLKKPSLQKLLLKRKTAILLFGQGIKERRIK
jgi:hypothetical protein